MIKIFSEKTQDRIELLKQHLKDYEKSVIRLNGFAEGRLTLKNKRYSFGSENYKRTKRDEERLPWTIHNLETQIQCYQHELEVLQEYGN